MKIVHISPRTEMAASSITGKMAGFYQDLARELGFENEAVDIQLSRFATISVRTIPENGEFDFELAVPTDTPEQLKAKCLKYIETHCYGEVLTAIERVRQADLPLTPREQQPGKLPEDADPN